MNLHVFAMFLLGFVKVRNRQFDIVLSLLS